MTYSRSDASSAMIFDSVSISRGEFRLDLDTAFDGGKLTVVLGPSGCGKTTLLDLAAGFLTPDSGRILEDGRDVTEMPPEKRRVGVVFQEHALFPHLSVLDNVAFGPSVRGMKKKEARKKAGDLLDLVDMGSFAARRPSSLSGGERQRVALARALAIDPALLLLDEPFSALDAALRRSLRREVRSLQEKTGITTIWVTHDQEEALSLADRLVVMHCGRLIQSGSPDSVWNDPEDLFTATFMGRATQLPVESFLGGGAQASVRAITPAGTVVLPGFPQLPEHPAMLVVRPEGIRPDANGPLKAVVDGVEYTGGGWNIRGRSAGGEGRFDWDEPGMKPPRVGEVVSLSVVSGAARILDRGCESD